jgi:hypothetical protein
VGKISSLFISFSAALAKLQKKNTSFDVSVSPLISAHLASNNAMEMIITQLVKKFLPLLGTFITVSQSAHHLSVS